MKPLLAILIPTTPDRQRLLDRLMAQLDKQRVGHEVIIILNEDQGHKNGGKTTGQKRNELLNAAREQNASHVAFIDSDDLISPRYIEAVMPGVCGGYDCCELWGQYYENGKQMNPFHHSIIHDHWWQDDKFYYRNPNHLNVTKLELLKDIRYRDITVGEDGNYSIDIQKSGLIKNEYPIKEIIYFYFAGSRKNHALEPAMVLKRGTKL